LARFRTSFLALALLVAIPLAAIGWRWFGPTYGRPAADAPPALARGGELIASTRGDPPSYNRLVNNHAGTDLVSLLTHAGLVRVNRATDQLEPWLAESWSASADGLTYTLKLRQAMFSDNTPFTADDVLFSFAAVYDPAVNSVIRDSLLVGGQPLTVSAPDPGTVVVTFPAPFAPGLRLLDNLPILPRHRLGAALANRTFADAWTPASPLEGIAGLGPFVLVEHVSAQRLVFRRNPHYFRRAADGTQLPYLDKLTLAIVPSQNTEALRLQAGDIDLMANGELRPTEYESFRKLEAAGRLRLHPIGLSLDPDFLWFNLADGPPPGSGRELLAQKGFRQAVSLALDRQAVANIVYLGNAVPLLGPIGPGNTTWYSADTPLPRQDQPAARALLAGLALADGNGDGLLERADGRAVRFSMLAQSGHLRAEVASMLGTQLRAVGIQVDLVLLDPQAMQARVQAGAYDSVYHGLQASSTDPAMNMDFWLSSGSSHIWNPRQTTPTPWERRIDALMHEQARAPLLADRQRAFAEVQRIMRDELPAVFVVAPRVTVATTRRVLNASPVLQLPQLLWSADTLASAAAPSAR
jgi:peptide/nickel transport system substrate-binding protein